MALSQTLQQKLQQRLSPQQIQLMKLLQIPTANLEERIKEELEENPALEVSEEGGGEEFEERGEEFDSAEEEYDGSEDEYENIDISDYVSDGDDETPDYNARDTIMVTTKNKNNSARVETTLHDLLIDQLGMLSLDERRFKIAEQM
jgi:RNA polymerase sigma-54 factor